MHLRELEPEEANRGSGLLAAGDFAGARELLERADAARPGDARIRGLLGLCYFKLDLLDDAAEIYEALASENPKDATLRVNLGLVQLKAGRVEEAVASLASALELAPEHRKALSYLGLALSQQGDHARARDLFARSGAEAMVARMDELLAAARAAPNVAVQEPAPQETRAALESEQPVSLPVTSDGTSLDGLPSLSWPEGAPFAVATHAAAIRFEAGILTRLDGLVAARGETAWSQVRKRFRGQLTDLSFGGGERQLWHGTGGGELLVSARDRVFTALGVAGELFVCEPSLFAFEEGLPFENGRLDELPLVRLAGEGRILLVSRAPLAREAVSGCLSVPLASVVAFTGSVTPRLLAGAEGPGVPWVELTGEGEVVLAS